MARITEATSAQEGPWRQRALRNRKYGLRICIACFVLQTVLLLLLSSPSSAQYARPSARRRARSDQETDVKQAEGFNAGGPNGVRDSDTIVNQHADADAQQAARGDLPHVPSTRQKIVLGNPEPKGEKTGGGKQAYVTMVTTTKYVVGAEVLAKSLKAVKASRPLVALVDSSLPAHVSERLTMAGWSVEYIGHVENKNKDKLQDRPWFNTTFSKLHVFGMKDYDKVIFLDADILLLDNLDALFDLTLDDEPSHPFAAASEVFPPDSFNSGVLVVQPSELIFQHLLQASTHITSYDGSDQGFLNTVFSKWWSLSSDHRLPFKYNVPQTLAMYFRPGWEQVQREGLGILHFAGDDSMKPWSFSGVVPPSLARYLFLWQELARAPLGADVTPIYHSVLGSAAGEDGPAVAELFGHDAEA